MLAWRFTRTDHLPDGSTRLRHCTIAVATGVTWYNAREHAWVQLGCGSPHHAAAPRTRKAASLRLPQLPALSWQPVPHAAASWVLRWRGHDAGRQPGKVLTAEYVRAR
jgi:hypothetical protein